MVFVLTRSNGQPATWQDGHVVFHVDRDLPLTVYICSVQPLLLVAYLGQNTWCDHVSTRITVGPFRCLYGKPRTAIPVGVDRALQLPVL